MVEFEDAVSERMAQLEEEDLERYQRDLDSQRRIVRMRRPIQRFEMSVQDYYRRFCYWKEDMISVGFTDDESGYIDYFIGDLQWHIRLRVLERRSSMSRLIDAYYEAHHHEVIISMDEFILDFRAANEIDEMASQTTVEIQPDDVLKVNELPDLDEIQSNESAVKSVELLLPNSFDKYEETELNEGNDCVVLGKMDAQIDADKLFVEMTEPVLEEDFLGIGVTKDAQSLLDERPKQSPTDSHEDSYDLSYKGGVLGVSDTNSLSLPNLGFTPHIFDPGTLAHSKQEDYERPLNAGESQLYGILVTERVMSCGILVNSSINEVNKQNGKNDYSSNYKCDDDFELNKVLTLMFDPDGSSFWHSNGGQQGEKVNDVGSIHHFFDIGLPQHITKKLNKEMYAIQDRVLEEMHHPNSISIQGGEGITNVENYSMLDKKQLQASETVTEGEKVLRGMYVSACAHALFIFPKAGSHMLDMEGDWQTDLPKLLNEITSPSPTGLQPHSTLFSSIEDYYSNCTLRNTWGCVPKADKMFLNESGGFYSSQDKGSGFGHWFLDEILSSYTIKLEICGAPYRHLRLSVELLKYLGYEGLATKFLSKLKFELNIGFWLGMILMFIFDPGAGAIEGQWNAYGGHVNVKCNCAVMILGDSNILEGVMVRPKDVVLASLPIQRVPYEVAGMVLVALTYTENMVYTLLSSNSPAYQNALVQSTHSNFHLLDGFKPSQSTAKRCSDTEHLNVGLMKKIGVPIVSSVDHFSEMFGSIITNIGLDMSRPKNFKLGLLLSGFKHLAQYVIANDSDVAIATLEGFVWDPGQVEVISFCIIEDNDVLKTKGIRIQLTMASKQDEKLNGASTHTGLLACSVVDWGILSLLITLSILRIRKSSSLMELFVRCVGCDSIHPNIVKQVDKLKLEEHLLHKNKILWRYVSLIDLVPWSSVAPLIQPFVRRASEHVHDMNRLVKFLHQLEDSEHEYILIVPLTRPCKASWMLGALMLLTISNVLHYDVLDAKTIEDTCGGYPNAKPRCIVVQTDHIIVGDWHYYEFLVPFGNVGFDCENIMDAMRSKRFDADSELHVVVQNLINKDINPSPRFGLVFSTPGLEHYIWDPGSSAALLGGSRIDGSCNITQYWINSRDLYGICMRRKAESLVTIGRSNSPICSLWLDIHEKYNIWSYGEGLYVPKWILQVTTLQVQALLLGYDIQENTIYTLLDSFEIVNTIVGSHSLEATEDGLAPTNILFLVAHFTTLRTRRLLRGRTCHVPRVKYVTALSIVFYILECHAYELYKRKL